MNCMVEGCKDEFIDTRNGLVEMMWHTILVHKPNEVNAKGYDWITAKKLEKKY